MKLQRLHIVEQYLSWQGHYKQYFENLISEKYNYIYCAAEKGEYPNATYLKSFYNNSRSKGFVNFVLSRFIDSFKAYRQVATGNSGLVHLIEFEPLSFYYFIITKGKRIPPLIITIHSIEQMTYASFVKNAVSKFQRRIYRAMLKRLAERDTKFVVHYQHHKRQLIESIGAQYATNITVINYPCPEVVVNTEIGLKAKSKQLLIYGQIREDKGIFEFLSNPQTSELKITLAGKIVDERILTLKLPNLTLINRFIPESELEGIVSTHDFMVLPYPTTYSGGAGTLKDSLSFGLPVLATNIPIFFEVISEGQVGFIWENVDGLLKYLDEVSEKDMTVLRQNALKYAERYNWKYMKKEYFKIYESLLEFNKKP
jgi:glycosyltransferase involved in cell wall biosynthesis